MKLSKALSPENIKLACVAPVLHDEILQFGKDVAYYKQENTNISSSVISKIEEITKRIDNKLSIDIYGSFATELCMPWSDIDLVIALGESGLSSTDILSAMSDLFEIEEIYFADIKYIPGATIPVLKATCTKSFNSIRIDVTVQDGRHNGLKCVELVKVYMTSYESLVHLVLPLKQFIFNSDLNDPYQGGLTSYGLILMIVAFLQLKQRQGADITCKRPNLGILLVDFMNFYMNFDYTGSLIKPFLPNAPLSKMIPYQKRVAQFNEMTQGMHIVDPINPTNNVSRATHRYYILRVRACD